MNIPDDAVKREWVSMEWCYKCDRDWEHLFIEFKDEPIVESECSNCRGVRFYEDTSE